MKHIKLFLSVIILLLMFVPVQAQKIDTKVYYCLTYLTDDGGMNLSIFEFQKGKFAPNAKEASSSDVRQLWRFVDVGKGFYRLVNASQPSMSLGLNSDPKSKVDIVLAKTSASLGQHWKLSPLTLGNWNGFRLANRSKASKCIDVTIENVRRVVLGEFERSSDQSWELNKTDISVTEKVVSVPAVKLDAKVYYRLSNKGSDVTDLPSNWVLGLREDDEGIKPSMKEPSEDVNQLWRFVEVEKGFFRLINASQPSMSLELFQSEGIAEYIYMVLLPTADRKAQQWKISPDGNGFRLTNRGYPDQSIEDNEMGVRTEKTSTMVTQIWILNKSDIKFDAKPEIKADGKFELTSTSFVNGARIPNVHTGKDGTSPPLAWKGAPAGTKSFMILCTDPDAPSPANPDPNPFVHWWIFNIPADTKYLLAGIPGLEQVSTPFGAVQLINSAGEIGFTGPMPPAGSGKHRYFFTIFALDRVHVVEPNMTMEKFGKILGSSVLAKTELMGTYEVPALSFLDSRLEFRSSEPLSMVLERALRAAQFSTVRGIRN